MIKLQIVVTEKCNLNCSYCYMNNNNTYLTRETFMEFYESLPSNQDFSIDFFGGEPLLNFDIIKFITETVKNDTRFKELSLFSNGLLITQEMVDYISDNNIQFHWSCDGLISDDLSLYMNKIGLIRQLCDKVSVTTSPNNLDIIGKHQLFYKDFGVTADIKFAKSGWTDESVNELKIQYESYMRFILDEFKSNRIKIPPNIIRDVSVLYEGIKKGTPKQKCVDSKYICLMPNGQQGFCAMKCTNGDFTIPEDYDHLYEECIDCEYTNFCGKGCHRLVKMNGIDTKLCEIQKFIFEQTIKFNHELNDDFVWIHCYIHKIFTDFNKGVS